MPLTNEEANAVNRLIDHVTNHPDHTNTFTTRAEAIDAFALLAEHAYKKLYAGYNGERARRLLEESWPVPTTGRAASPAPTPKRQRAADMPKCTRCHVIRAEVGDLCIYCAKNES